MFPQDDLYQYQFAPALKLPPVKLSVVPDPVHIADGLPVAELAGDEFPITVTVTEDLSLTHCNTFHDSIT